MKCIVETKLFKDKHFWLNKLSRFSTKELQRRALGKQARLVGLCCLHARRVRAVFLSIITFCYFTARWKDGNQPAAALGPGGCTAAVAQLFFGVTTQPFRQNPQPSLHGTLAGWLERDLCVEVSNI